MRANLILSRRELLVAGAALACAPSAGPRASTSTAPVAIVGVGTAARAALAHYVRSFAPDDSLIGVVDSAGEAADVADLQLAVGRVMLVVAAGGRTAERLGPPVAEVLSRRYAVESLLTLPFLDDPTRARATSTAAVLQRLVPCITIDFGTMRGAKPVRAGEQAWYEPSMAAAVGRALFLELHPEAPARRMSALEWAVRSKPPAA